MQIVYLGVECHRSELNSNISEWKRVQFCVSYQNVDASGMSSEKYLQNFSISGATQRIHDHSLLSGDISHFECIPQVIPFFGIRTPTNGSAIDDWPNIYRNSMARTLELNNNVYKPMCCLKYVDERLLVCGRCQFGEFLLCVCNAL